MDTLLTVSETAVYLRKSKLTILNLIKKEIIPAEKIGHQWLINLNKLQEKFENIRTNN